MREGCSAGGGGGGRQTASVCRPPQIPSPPLPPQIAPLGPHMAAVALVLRICGKLPGVSCVRRFRSDAETSPQAELGSVLLPPTVEVVSPVVVVLLLVMVVVVVVAVVVSVHPVGKQTLRFNRADCHIDRHCYFLGLGLGSSHTGRIDVSRAVCQRHIQHCV